MDRLERKLLGEVARASADFALLEPGDRVLVAVSGGKDSHAMLYLLRELRIMELDRQRVLGAPRAGLPHVPSHG